MNTLSEKEGIFTISIKFRFLGEKGFWQLEGNVKFLQSSGEIESTNSLAFKYN